MDKEEYLKRRKAILDKVQVDLDTLAEEAVMPSAVASIGDVVISGCGIKVRVDRIIASASKADSSYVRYPFLVYVGALMTGRLKPYKNGDQDTLCDDSVVRVIKAKDLP